MSSRIFRQGCSSIAEIDGCSVRFSAEPDDPDWDDFLERTPGSAYAQTSSWGRLRTSIGWRVVRVVISHDGRVVGGAQILIRRLPAGGNFGLVSRGPVVSEDRSDLVGLVLDQMLALGRASGVQYLILYPPRDGDWMDSELVRRGLRTCSDVVDSNYTATVCVDLRQSLDTVFAAMAKRRRASIRAAERRGVTVRQGTEADLPVFNRLKDQHAARLGYERRGQEYYEELWGAFAARGHAALFLAEYEGEPVSAVLAIPFGDTCYHLERPWSGEHADLRPNELVEWEVLTWAKSEGYRFADLGGVLRASALATPSSEGDASKLTGWEDFKLAFGGLVTLLPEGYDHVYNPVWRFAYRNAPPNALRAARQLAERVRMRAWGRRAT